MRFESKNIKIALNYVVGPLVFMLLAYSTLHQLKAQPDWRSSLHAVGHSLGSQGLVLLLAAGAFMGVNWGLEARKWQLANASLETLSFWTCWKAVMSGVTMASFTPNRMGEYLGRMLLVEEGKRLRSIPLTLACSMAQLQVTLWAGLAGVLMVTLVPGEAQAALSGYRRVLLPVLAVFLVVAVGAFTWLFFRIPHIVSWGRRLRISEKSLEYVKLLQGLPPRLLLRILLLSIFRYGIFLVQYDLAFRGFGVALTAAQLFAGISLMFVGMALLPTWSFLAELGIRWQVAIQVMTLYSNNLSGIFAASLFIWLVNLILPAIAGSLVILRIKIFR